jgi:hypothetical protein
LRSSSPSADPTDHHDAACRRYELPAEFTLSDPTDFLRVGVRMGINATGGKLRIFGTTVELERVP